MTKFILLMIFSVSNLAFAEDYYNVLKREFRDADVVLSIADFDQPGHPLARLCIEIYEDRPMSENYVMINRYTRVIEGQGPLLPKATINKIIYRPYNSDVFGGNLFDLVSTEFDTTEVTSVQKNSWTLTVRKTSAYLIFAREYVVGEDTLISYGYCFHRDSKK